MVWWQDKKIRYSFFLLYAATISSCSTKSVRVDTLTVNKCHYKVKSFKMDNTLYDAIFFNPFSEAFDNRRRVHCNNKN